MGQADNWPVRWAVVQSGRSSRLERLRKAEVQWGQVTGERCRFLLLLLLPQWQLQAGRQLGHLWQSPAGAQAERNKANKLMAKNMFFEINLAFMAIPLFFSEQLSERVGSQFCADCLILFIGYPTRRKNA